MKILFMCVANSARSQLAEALAKNIFKETVEIQRAGSLPSKVNPLAVEVLREVGIDISKQYSKSTDSLSPAFIVSIDYVITLCAEEVCPMIVARRAKKLHWPLPDPAGHPELTYDEKLQLFRITRDTITTKLIDFKKELQL